MSTARPIVVVVGGMPARAQVRTAESAHRPVRAVPSGLAPGPTWARRSGSLASTGTPSTLTAMPGFDPQEMVARFRARAEAVRTRGMPPIEGPERQRFREQAQRDFADYAMIGDAEAELVDGILTLRIDLRPPSRARRGRDRAERRRRR